MASKSSRLFFLPLLVLLSFACRASRFYNGVFLLDWMQAGSLQHPQQALGGLGRPGKPKNCIRGYSEFVKCSLTNFLLSPIMLLLILHPLPYLFFDASPLLHAGKLPCCERKEYEGVELAAIQQRDAQGPTDISCLEAEPQLISSLLLCSQSTATSEQLLPNQGPAKNWPSP